MALNDRMTGAPGVLAGCMIALCVAGCDNGGITVNNKNPLGTVGGLVLDGATMMPLPGVTVTILSAGGTFPSTTGTDGFYRISAVPAGAFTVQLSKDTYLAASVQGSLDGSAGNFPISDPIATLSPIGLVPVGPDFAVRVVDTTGVAVANVAATLRTTFSYVDLSTPSQPRFVGDLTLSATTAADGRLVFKGLPDLVAFGYLLDSQTYVPGIGYVTASGVVINVAPVAVMGQDNYQYAGGIFIYDLLQLGTTLPQIVLSGPTDALTVVESNLAWLRSGFVLPYAANLVNGSIVSPMGPITIAFSEAVDPSTLRVQVTSESGAPGPVLTPTVDLNLVSLVPATSFTAGARYNLLLHADAALYPGGSARQVNTTAPFFAAVTDGSTPTAVSAKLTGSTVQIVLSEPLGVGNGIAQSYACVVFYEGVNLDGSAAGQQNVAGEWSSDPAALSCSLVTPVTSPVLDPQFVDSSAIVGSENMGAPAGMPVTGFATVFNTTFREYTTTPPAMPQVIAPGSAAPVVGTKGHLYFPKVSATVRRANGQPVTDIPFTLQ